MEPREFQAGHGNESEVITETASTTESPTRVEGVKETIESIVVALILAFVFRAFVIEAFVIPTGSMAPTLYGAHGTIVLRGLRHGVRIRTEGPGREA